MSEQINKVLASTAQAFSTAEQKQARDNIDAQQSITFNYSGSNITALNGSAIAQSGALTYVTHDSNLTGSGTSGSPLGLASEITLSSTGLPYVNTINSYSMYMHDDSATSYVGLGYNYFRDSAGGEMYIHSDHITINDAGDLSVSIHPTGIFINEHNGGDEDLTIGNRSIVFSKRDSASQVVDFSSIERWNSYSAGLFTGLDHDSNLSGLGTSASLLGLHDPMIFTAQRSAEDPVSSMKLAYSGVRFEVPSAWTAEHSFTNSKIGYEWPSALDTENHRGWYSHSMLDGRSMSLSAHDCSYIKCNVITATTVDSPYMGIYGGYGSGYNQTSIIAAVSDQNRPDPYISFNASGSSELVDMSSIRRWNTKQDASGMSAFVPYSAVKADADSAVTSINGSAVGKFTGVSSNNNITGNGLSSSPVGLKVPVFMSDNSVSAEYGINGLYMSSDPYTATHYSVGGWNIYSTGNATHHRSVGANASGIEINWDTNYYVMKLSASGLVTMDAWAPSRNRAEFNYDGAIESSHEGKSSTWNASSLKFADSASATQVVDASSIARWNSYSAGNWSESGNPLSTGFGGNQVTAASQYNVGAGNWAARTVKMSGLPDQTMYGFQSRPNGNGIYGVNQAGAFVAVPQQNYFVHLFHQTGATMEVMDTSFYPTGLTANARLDFVNLCSACSANIKTDTFHGNTANIDPGQSATMWYIADVDIWTDGSMPVPV